MTVQADDFQDGKFKLQFRLSRFQSESVLHRLVPGRRIQMRRPGGRQLSTKLEKVYVDGLTREGYSDADEATLYSFPTDPTILLRFKPTLTETLAPPGTEIWLID